MRRFAVFLVVTTAKASPAHPHDWAQGFAPTYGDDSWVRRAVNDANLCSLNMATSSICDDDHILELVPSSPGIPGSMTKLPTDRERRDMNMTKKEKMILIASQQQSEYQFSKLSTSLVHFTSAESRRSLRTRNPVESFILCLEANGDAAVLRSRAVALSPPVPWLALAIYHRGMLGVAREDWAKYRFTNNATEEAATAADPRFDVLVDSVGLRPEHLVVDAGCGWGRLGLRLIEYLYPKNYVGVDVDEFSLRAFIQFEIGVEQPHLIKKSPHILRSETFALHSALKSGGNLLYLRDNDRGHANFVIFSAVLKPNMPRFLRSSAVCAATQVLAQGGKIVIFNDCRGSYLDEMLLRTGGFSSRTNVSTLVGQQKSSDSLLLTKAQKDACFYTRNDIPFAELPFSSSAASTRSKMRDMSLPLPLSELERACVRATSAAAAQGGDTCESWGCKAAAKLLNRARLKDEKKERINNLKNNKKKVRSGGHY